MTVTYTLKMGTEPTPEQLREIREAAKRPIVFDEDCPPMTEEQLARFKPRYPQREDRVQ